MLPNTVNPMNKVVAVSEPKVESSPEGRFNEANVGHCRCSIVTELCNELVFCSQGTERKTP